MPLVAVVFVLDSFVCLGHFVDMSEMRQIPDCNAIVVGAGLAGLAGALALANAGATVYLCDAGRRPNGKSGGVKADPRVTALSPSSVTMLEALGVPGDLRAVPVAGMQVTAAHPDAGLGGGLLAFGDAGQTDAPLAYIQPNGDLHRSLLAAAGAHPDIRLIFDATIERVDVQDAQAALVCADGQVFQTQLLIGADGRRSVMRQQAGIAVHDHDYGATAIVTTITHTAPHEQIARQFFKPGGPLACLPLGKARNGWLTSVVWPETNELAAALLGLHRRDLQAELADRLDGLLGEVIQIQPPVSYPLGLMLAETYVGQRMALLGEAAHIIHPLAGQGYNLTLRDAAQLADCFYDARRLGLDVGAATTLAHYDSLRRRDVSLMASATHVFATVFSGRRTDTLAQGGFQCRQPPAVCAPSCQPDR